jgi:hypothetical protein
LAESRNRLPSILAWATFVAASIIILLIASSALHYAPGNSGATFADEFGALLPYGLIVGLLLFYILKAVKGSGATLQGTRFFFSNMWKVVAIAVMFLVVVFTVKLFSIPTPPINGSTTGSNNLVPGTPIPSTSLPTLSPFIFIGAIAMIVGIAILLSLSSIRRRHRAEEETPKLVIQEKGPGDSLDRSEIDDMRRAIIYRYVQGRNLLVGRGAIWEEGMTAREFERKVDLSYENAGCDLVPLTRLFEEARFSVHPMGHAEKEKADNHYLRLETTLK